MRQRAPRLKTKEIVLDVSQTAHDLAGAGKAIEAGPLGALGQVLVEPPMLYSPVADDEIEIIGRGWRDGQRHRDLLGYGKG